MDMKISDVLYHLEVFEDLQLKLHPDLDKHSKAGFGDSDFYEVPVEG